MSPTRRPRPLVRRSSCPPCLTGAELSRNRRRRRRRRRARRYRYGGTSPSPKEGARRHPAHARFGRKAEGLAAARRGSRETPPFRPKRPRGHGRRRLPFAQGTQARGACLLARGGIAPVARGDVCTGVTGGLNVDPIRNLADRHRLNRWRRTPYRPIVARSARVGPGYQSARERPARASASALCRARSCSSARRSSLTAASPISARSSCSILRLAATAARRTFRPFAVRRRTFTRRSSGFVRGSGNRVLPSRRLP